MSALSLLRTFIACATPCPPGLARLLKELGGLGSAVKASSPRGLHCTLRFLGDTSPETAEQLGPAIAAAVAGVCSFSVELVGIGAFPDPQHPNVIWAGLPADPLTTLFERIENVAIEFGYRPEQRPFHPHVTLARVKHRPPPRLAELMQEHAGTRWGTFDVTSVELFQSTPTPSGSRYDVLTSAPLRR
jgi:2'-5' RNA ligase